MIHMYIYIYIYIVLEYLVSNLLHGTVSLRNWWSQSWQRNVPPFMDSEVSLPCPRETALGPIQNQLDSVQALISYCVLCVWTLFPVAASDIRRVQFPLAWNLYLLVTKPISFLVFHGSYMKMLDHFRGMECETGHRKTFMKCQSEIIKKEAGVANFKTLYLATVTKTMKYFRQRFEFKTSEIRKSKKSFTALHNWNKNIIARHIQNR
jgi:hypothetical protein